MTEKDFNEIIDTKAIELVSDNLYQGVTEIIDDTKQQDSQLASNAK